ncbi:MAG: hypothetical protein ACPLSY_03175 [Moorellaceae bacterium]
MTIKHVKGVAHIKSETGMPKQGELIKKAIADTRVTPILRKSGALWRRLIIFLRESPPKEYDHLATIALFYFFLFWLFLLSYFFGWPVKFQ